MTHAHRCLWLLVVGLSASLGCGSSSSGPGATAAPGDGGGLASLDATVGASDDASDTDGSRAIDGAPTPGPDGGAPCGDRNLGVRETYPAPYRIQNGGRVYDVTAPPTPAQHAAKGDGVTDDTVAFLDAWDYLKQQFLAHSSWAYGGGPIVYLPDGTYLVTDTLIYRGASLEAPTGYNWIDVVDVRFAGESREGTILKLKDHATGFDDATKPKIVLAYQHPDTRFNNIPANNGLRNLTVDVGSGNPGAVGVAFQGANLTAMRNVLVRSGDGSGSYGFWFRLGSAQGHYSDLSVDGFDYGIFQNQGGEINTSFEHVTLRNQRVAAIEAGAGLSARDVCADETKTTAQALRIDEDGTQGVVVDSTFKGAAHAPAFELKHADKQSLFLRNVTTSGYDQAVTRADAGGLPGPDVDEWSALPTVTLFDGGAAKSLRLPIEDTPLVAWGDPAAWANVDDFGAAGDGHTDDTAAVQRAMDSGKAVVVFRRAAYVLSKALKVPATVERVDLMYSELGSPSFDVTGAATTPLLIERGGSYGTVTLKAARPIVITEMSGRFANALNGPAKVYIENAANIGNGDAFAPAGQTMWARSLNDEDAPPAIADIDVHGGTAWIFNYKTENKPVTSLLASTGSVVEVFNGYVNSTEDAGATPMVVNDHSNVSFIGYTNLGFYVWKTSLEEGRDAGTRTVTPAALPVRDKNDVFIPLYSGDAR